MTRKRGSLAVIAALDRARQEEFDAAGWGARPGHRDQQQRRWERAVERVNALEAELIAVTDAERAVRAAP